MSTPSETNDRDRVLEATDIVSLVAEQVRLDPKGDEFVGLCPFHEDSKPSMYVVPRKGFYHCFACGAHGNAIDFLMNFHRMEFLEALETLAGRAGMELSRVGSNESRASAGRRTLLLRANALAAKFFSRMLTEEEGDAGRVGRAILESRGIGEETAEKFGMGIAPDAWSTLVDRIEAFRRDGTEVDGNEVPDLEIFEAAGLVRPSKRGTMIDAFRNRLIFAIRDELGRPIAFGARKIDPEDEPKYLNSPETDVFHKGGTMYGLDLAAKSIAKTRTAIICEGYTDVIALHAAGFENAVATLGTALTRHHADRLGRFCDTVILLFDGDLAGQRAADRAVEIFFSSTVDVQLCTLPDGLDPDELLRRDGGPAEFKKALASAIDAPLALLADFRKALDVAGGVSARQRIVDDVINRLNGLGLEGVAGVRRSFIIDQIAAILGVTPSMLDQGTRRFTPRSSETADTEAPEELAVMIRAAGGRRRAEESVVRLALADTALLSRTISMQTGDRTLLQQFEHARFEDPPCREAWRLMESTASAGSIPDGPDLIAAIENEGIGCIVSALFVEGLREVSVPDVNTAELLEQAAETLQAAIERDIRLADRSDLASRPIASADEALAAINKIRASGSDPAAIGRRRVGRVGGRFTDGSTRDPSMPTSFDAGSHE
ncbi:MAG: DNA primase [Phycisphaerales bacterium]|nr:DNA primase [Phycisphaerales bacterium]